MLSLPWSFCRMTNKSAHITFHVEVFITLIHTVPLPLARTMSSKQLTNIISTFIPLSISCQRGWQKETCGLGRNPAPCHLNTRHHVLIKRFANKNEF
jgi:hypothetical protein